MRLILHIGVHRTGTTALQDALQRRADFLARHGVGFWGPDLMRLPGPAGYLADMRAGWRDPAAAARVIDTRRTFREELDRAAAGGGRLIIVSEENLAGGMGENFTSGLLYPDIAQRLAYEATMLSVRPSRVYLSVRSYADYWNSAYAFTLRGKKRVRQDETAERIAEGAARRRWPAVLADVAAAFAGTRVRVWRYSPVPEMLRGVILDMVGWRLARFMPEARRANRSLSTEALSTFKRLQAEGEIETDAERAKALKALSKEAGPRPDLFTPEDHARLAAMFEDDWALIAAGGVPGVETFDPEVRSEEDP